MSRISNHIECNQEKVLNAYNPKISVIVPCYNVEKYIEECLDSIIRQTYSNLEIILVDDGSKDSTGAIIDRYAEIDKRIVTIHKRNGGLSSARNAGLDIMTGDLVSFVDSDDYVDVHLYEYVVSAWETNRDAYFAQFGFIHFIDGTEVPPCEDDFTFEMISNKKAIGYHVLNDLYNSVWNKVYRRDIFNNLRFLEGRIIEDIPVSLEVYYKYDKIINIYKKMYYYRNRPYSIMNGDSRKIYEAMCENARYLIEGKYKNDKSFIKYSTNFVMRSLTKNFIFNNRMLLNDTNVVEIENKKNAIDQILKLRKYFKYKFELYENLKLKSINTYVKAKLFEYSPKILLFYDNPFLEVKLFIKRLLGRY